MLAAICRGLHSSAGSFQSTRHCMAALRSRPIIQQHNPGNRAVRAAASFTAEPDSFDKLNGLLFNSMNKQLSSSPAERLQLFVPYQPLSTGPEADKIVAQAMDGRPAMALFAGQKSVSTATPFVPFTPLKPATVPLPTSGYINIYINGLMSQLIGEEGRLKKALGEYWRDYMTFKKMWRDTGRGPGLPGSKLCLDAFLDEVYEGSNPRAVSTAFAADQLAPINAAVRAALDYKETFDADSYSDLYSCSYKMIQERVAASDSKTVTFNSSTDSSDTRETWAKAEMGVKYNFFSATGEAEYNELSKKVESSKIKMTWAVEHHTSFNISENRGGWFSLSAIMMTRNSPDAFVDKRNHDIHFDKEQGDLVWFSDSIIVGSGISLEMEIIGDFSDEELKVFKSRESVGYWPCFSASGEGGSRVERKDSGETGLKVTMGVGDKSALWVIGRKIGNVFEK